MKMGFDVSNLYVGRSARRGYAQSTQDANQARIDQLRHDAESVTAQGFLAEEAAENERVEAERLAAVRAVEAELSRNLVALRSEDRARVLNAKDDPSVFHDPDEPRAFFTVDEANVYNKQQVRQFLDSTPEYFADPAGRNLTTIHEFLVRNGHDVIVSKRKLKQVFERLSSLGLLIERPAQTVTAPAYVAPVTAASAPVKTLWDVNEYPYFQDPGGKSTDMISGWDPNGSGERVTLTRRAVEQMDLNSFKFFGRPTVKTTPEWALVESREMVARQFTELGRGR